MSVSKLKCPIVICTYNRPDYLEKCLKSISEIKDINEISVYVFCDGGEDATIDTNLKIIREYFPLSKTFIQQENLCIPKHVNYIRKKMFDEMGYDRIMFVEDDIMISPYYHSLMNKVFDIYENYDPTVGAVNSSTICLDTYNEKLHNQRYFGDMLSHLNNYVMSKKTWNCIKPIMEEYIYKFVYTSLNYRDINHEDVIKWARNKIMNSKIDISKRDRVMNFLTSSNDSITNMAMRINNLRYVCSYVNRILNIGKYGYHYSIEDFEKHRLNKMSLDIMPLDKDEPDFIIDMDNKIKYKI